MSICLKSICVYINYVGHLRYPKGDELWPFEI